MTISAQYLVRMQQQIEQQQQQLLQQAAQNREVQRALGKPASQTTRPAIDSWRPVNIGETGWGLGGSE